jgi:hypothetical protein
VRCHQEAQGYQAVRNELKLERQKRELDRQERTRNEIVTCANPILIASEDLLGRLYNVIEDYGYGPLAQDWDSRKPADWSDAHDYFMSSTLYLFGRYFASVHLLREGLGIDEFPPQYDKDELFRSLRAVDSALSEYPAPYNKEGCPGGDTQVFSWQQRALGEVLTRRNGNATSRVFTYAEFLDSRQSISNHLEPLRILLLNISPNPGGNCRWLRLSTAREALKEVRSQRQRLLALPVSSEDDQHSA